MPTTYKCCVPNCGSSSVRSQGNNDKKIGFFSFPKSTELQKQWLRFLKIQFPRFKVDFSNKDNRICSLHFTESDFYRDLQNELLEKPTKLILRENAVPSMKNQAISSSVSGSALRRNARVQKKQQKEIVTSLLENYQKDNAANQDANNMEMEDVSTLESQQIPSRENHYLESELNTRTCEEENVKLKLQNSALETQIVQLKKQLFEANEEKQKFRDAYQKTRNCYNKFKHCSQSLKNRTLDRAVRNMLSKVLSNNQIDILLKKKKQVRWTPDELAVAITIRYFSAKCYSFLRSKLNYPLPALRTLNNWVSKLNMGRGHLEDVLRIMNICASSYSEIDKLAVIVFDEMQVDYMIEYLESTEEVVGPFKKMQVSIFYFKVVIKVLISCTENQFFLLKFWIN
jgi:hypothetical protein